ncbi:MarR family winged helix-turn-helix transcriptional regulator [Janibacter sp. CX7]|uniref:MarR family winged helix-turn-helix transcriptional regulator n=1 Tax=Janibacter sp. CX7 TaxID=2963431 RepID=UPI0020CCDB7B|nr:MarR family winged helix-turn-helix transcriptional regulator [Janibacter sp. CX7]UTT66155.1 MarR family winged helix-turn-helix transcriptional regulator [Janibacter sp. CX7]
MESTAQAGFAETSLTPTDGPAWTAIKVSARWERARRHVEVTQQLKVAEGRLLWLLRDGQPRSLRQIAEELDLEQSTVNRQVHAALESGVVERSRPQDSPTYVITMSEQGRDRFLADMERLLRVYGHGIAAVPAAEQERFLEHLEAFATAIGDCSQAPAGPAGRGASASEPRDLPR